VIANAAVHGVAGWHELLALGVGRGSIAKRVARGHLHPIYRGVYAVGHADLTLHGRWRAAVLSCGPHAVLSHRDAAHLWDFRRSARRAIDVTAPGRSRHLRDGITIHRPRALHRDDVTTHERIPVTTIARTLLDLAEVLTPRQLRRAYEEAQRSDRFDLRAIQATMARAHGRRGLKPLGVLAAEQLDAPATKRELEARFYDVLREFGLPMPHFNAALHGYEVDALWPEQRIVVELDSYEFHGKSRARHDRDRVKQVHLQLKGYRVLPYTWRMLSDPAAAAAQLRTFLVPATSRP
jgi:very-short-patch-repair endonuclease